MVPMMLAGMGAGLLKSELIDRPQANKQRQLAATTAALSPWTGMTPTMPQEANPLGSMMQGGLAGAQIGQGMQQAAPAATTQTAEQIQQGVKDQVPQTLQNAAPGTMTPKIRPNVYDRMAQNMMLS
jgi:hypothetical protein